MDHNPDNGGGTSDFEMPTFDLESQRLEFDTSSEETDSSSVFDCSLDESFQQIKNDLERLHLSTPKNTSSYRTPTTCPNESSTVVDDDFPEIDIDQRFDVMKDRVRNYRSKETETLRRCIIELNNTITCVIDNEGKNVCRNKKILCLILVWCFDILSMQLYLIRTDCFIKIIKIL